MKESFTRLDVPSDKVRELMLLVDKLSRSGVDLLTCKYDISMYVADIFKLEKGQQYKLTFPTSTSAQVTTFNYETEGVTSDRV